MVDEELQLAAALELSIGMNEAGQLAVRSREMKCVDYSTVHRS